MDSRANTPFWADKSFWLVILSPLLLLAGKKIGVSFDAAEIAGWVAMNIAFVAGNKWKSGKVLAEEIKAESARAAASVPVQASPSAALSEAGK